MPRPRRQGYHFGKPVKSGSRWRVLRRGGPEGEDVWIYFDTEAEAKAARRQNEFEKTTTGRVVGEAVIAYIADLKADGAAQNTIKAETNFLAAVFPDPAEPIGDIGPGHYDELRKRPGRRPGETVAAATHQRALRTGKQFLAWCIGKGWLRKNPLADVKPKGKAKKGKKQLTLDEANKWMVVAEQMAPTNPACLAALLCACLGLRSSEVRSRQVRDLDRGGSVLWVSGKGAEERVPLALTDPEAAFLLPLLAMAKKDKLPQALLIDCTPFALTYWARKICDKAGVPRVCPHSLRGLASTAGLEGGAAIGTVCRVLRHGVQVDRQHYAAKGAEQAGQRRALLRVIRPGSNSPESDPEKQAG